MFGYQLIGARDFFERLQVARKELTDFSEREMPITTYSLGILPGYSDSMYLVFGDAQNYARKFLRVLDNMKENAKLFCGDILLVKDFEFKRPHDVDGRWEKRVSSVSFSRIEKFVEGLDKIARDARGVGKV